MRRLIAIGLLAFCASPTQADIAFVRNHGGFGDKNTATSESVTLTGVPIVGNLLVGRIALDPAAGAVSCSDNASTPNTYTVDIDAVNGSGSSGVRTFICSAAVVNVPTTMTFSFPSEVARGSSVDEYSGTDTTSSRVDASSTTTGTGTTNVVSTVTVNTSGSIVIAAVGVEGPTSQTYTEDSHIAWTTRTRKGTASGATATNITSNGADFITSSTGQINYHPTLGTSALWAEALVASTPAAPAAPKNVPRQVIITQEE